MEIPERLRIILEIIEEHGYVSGSEALREFRARTIYGMGSQKFYGYLEGLADAGIIKLKRIGQTKVISFPDNEAKVRFSEILEMVRNGKNLKI
jgi:hypothetical protein